MSITSALTGKNQTGFDFLASARELAGCNAVATSVDVNMVVSAEPGASSLKCHKL